MAPILASLRREGGQTLPIVAVIMVGIIAIAGLVIDLGNVERVRAQMQNAADAAATSGASTLLDRQFDVARATDTARRFGMDSQGINQVAGVDTDTVSQRVQVGCDSLYSACGSATPNTVTVHESASVPTFFMSIFGITSLDVSTEAEACAPCTSAPHDIMLVLDRTGSMAAPGKGSSNGVRKIDNLKNALLQGFLPSLDGQDDRVGMVVFPPDTAGSPACSPKDNANNYRDYYDPTRNYLEVGLTGGYLNPDGTLNPSSPVIEDIDCMMPFSRTDYADSLMAAEREFDAHARPGVAKVIVMISDGAANQIDDPRCTTSTAEQWACAHPCEAGIANADTLKKGGTEIYAIVYSDLEGDEYCGATMDYGGSGAPKNPMTGYEAMKQIASPGDYLEDPDPANLVHILHQVSGAISGDNTSHLVK